MAPLRRNTESTIAATTGRVASMSGALPSRASANTAVTVARACLRKRLARRISSISDTGLPAAARRGPAV
jgi:hypothetical protein